MRRGLAIGACVLITGSSLLALVESTYRIDPNTANVIWRGATPVGAPADRIDALCRADSYVYVWGNEPAVYFLARRQSVSRYPDLFALEMPQYDNQRRVAELADDLRKTMPCAIVDTSPGDPIVAPLDPQLRAQWSPSIEEGGIHSYAAFQPVYDFVSANYAPLEQVGGYALWLRR
jgi:hypothetical protein